jgi:hypothetical protein
MPTPTYDLIATTTLAATAPEVVFGSIPQGFRDLVVVYNGQFTSAANFTVRLNADTGSNYNHVVMRGPVDSGTGTYDFFYAFWNNAQSGSRQIMNLNIMDYSATDKQKTLVNRTGYTRTDGGDSIAEAQALRWASTSAVTTVQIAVNAGNFAVGSTFALYGIAA